jgi:acetyl-CoA carboxylase carboxyl transferase subunit beta
MSWFNREKKSLEVGEERKVIPEGLWLKCVSCKEPVWKKDIDSNLQVCPKCNHHYKLKARDRLDLLFDGSWTELDAGVFATDPLEFTAAKAYKTTLESLSEKKRSREAVLTAEGRVGGYGTVIAAMEYGFIGGSMGSVVGEKITRAVERAIKGRSALIIVSSSGGARMQEGALSLMQMAKISSALARFDRLGLPYISLLTDPTTGGVSASFAMLGDLNIAEPNALIGFAGPRVIEQTIRQTLPEGFQRSEFLLEHGMLDAIVERRELKPYLIRSLKFFIA